jgi:Bacterial Ig domain
MKTYKNIRLFSHLSLWLIALTFLGLSPRKVEAATVVSVVVGWDNNSDSLTRGYYFYYSSAGVTEFARVDIGTQTTATISSLIEGESYVFYVTAYSATGAESAPSEKLYYTAPIVNTAPIVQNVDISGAQDKPLSIALKGSDRDADPLTYQIVASPSNGIITKSTSSAIWTYTPAPGFFGKDSFTYRVSDGIEWSGVATVLVTIIDSSSAAANSAPVAYARIIRTAKATPVSFTLTGADLNGDKLTFNIATLPKYGVITGTAPNLVYTPNATFTGTDVMRFTVSDGQATSAGASVIFAVTTTASVIKTGTY